MNLYDELLALVDALERNRIEYALCGGLAVVIHGYPRLTKDIDIMLRGEDLERTSTVVGALGFRIPSGRIPFRIGQPQEQIVYRLVKTVDRKALALDLMPVPPFLEDVWRSRTVMEWQKRTVEIVSREGLAKMKRIAGRRQDLADLEILGLLDHDETPRA